MSKPLTEHLLDIAALQQSKGAPGGSLFARCCPELLYDLVEENLTGAHKYSRGWGIITLHTPAGLMRVQEDHSMWESDGIVVYRQVGHVPVPKVSL